MFVPVPLVLVVGTDERRIDRPDVVSSRSRMGRFRGTWLGPSGRDPRSRRQDRGFVPPFPPATGRGVPSISNVVLHEVSTEETVPEGIRPPRVRAETEKGVDFPEKGGIGTHGSGTGGFRETY